MLKHEFIYVVYISGVLVEQSTDGFDIMVRRNHTLKPEQWSNEWVEMSQEDYKRWKLWLFDWVFTHDLKDEPPGEFKII